VRRLAVAVALALALGGCAPAAPDAAVDTSGLVPVPVDDVLAPVAVPVEEPITNPYLRATKAALHRVSDTPFPAPPPPLDYAALFADAAQPRYAGWDTDRLDASSYEALTNSVNAILERMPEKQAKDFDRLVKYVLMNTTRDPFVAKKAVGGGQVSDAEILQVIQSYLHERTPREVAELARRLYESQQRGKRPGGNAAAVPGTVGLEGMP
jgi:hypothetical protein